MSFGFGVTDFIVLCTLSQTIRKRFVDSPKQLQAVCDEVRGLSNALRDLDDVLPERELDDQQTADIKDYSRSCTAVLEDLTRVLDKYQEIENTPTGVGSRTRRLWKRLNFEPEDVRHLRSRLISNIGVLNSFYASLTRKEVRQVKSDVDRLLTHQEDQESLAIVNWLSSSNSSAHHDALFSRCEEGTGQWLLESEEFKSWLGQPDQCLFCPGIPGAGKTMIACIVVEHLLSRFRNDGSTGISFLYCNYKRQEEQNLEFFLASMLKQFVQSLPKLPASVKKLHELHASTPTRPSIAEYMGVLRAVMSIYPRLFIVVDALDECTIRDNFRTRLMQTLFEIQSSTKARVFATSRHIPQIMATFKANKSLQVEIRANESDVRRYIETRMENLPSFVRRDNVLRQELCFQVAKATDGMFLLAKLHMDSLQYKTTVKAMKIALGTLTTGSAALSVAYTEAIDRIQSQPAELYALARNIISWITCAERQLTVTELQHALAIEMKETMLDKDNIPDTEDMVSVCAGLVTVDEQTNVIRFVHYTTQEHFENIQESWLPDAQDYIARCCLSYLSYDVFATRRLRREALLQASQEYPLLDYAARFWAKHASAAQTEDWRQLAGEFLNHSEKVYSCFDVLRCDYNPRYMLPYSELKGIHVAAFLGQTTCVEDLLQSGCSPNPKDDSGRTPMSYAADRGHEDVIRCLLKHEKTDAAMIDSFGMTPLSFAAQNGHEMIVEVLLDQVNVQVNASDTFGLTPLSHAAQNDHSPVARLLLARADIQPEKSDKKGRTPLSFAAQCGNENITRLLLSRMDVDLNASDRSGHTPLLYAVGSANTALVQLYLDRIDVQVNASDDFGLTPLLYAAQNGDEAIVRSLLARSDIDVNKSDHTGQTPLSHAVRGSYEIVVRLLLDRVDIHANEPDNHGRTPLLHAVQSKNEAVTRLLLAQLDIQADTSDIDGRTPLSYAAECGNQSLVRLLLDHGGVQADEIDNDGRTPLSYAAESGNDALIRLFLERDDVDIDKKSASGRTPLSYAVAKDEDTNIPLLLGQYDLETYTNEDNVPAPLWFARLQKRRFRMMK